MLISKDDASGEIAEPDSTDYGHDDSYDRNQLTPGLPLIAYTVTFEYAKSYQPQPTIRLAISELIYTTRYLASDEEGWKNGTYSFQYHLPVRVLPPVAG